MDEQRIRHLQTLDMTHKHFGLNADNAEKNVAKKKQKRIKETEERKKNWSER